MKAGWHRITWGVLVAAVLLSACSEDGSSPVRIQPPPPLPFPASPDIIMENFLATYERLEQADLAALLHPDYACELRASTAMRYPELGPTLDRAEALTIHGHMFGGQTGRDHLGEVAAPVVGIKFQILEQIQPWAAAEPGYGVPGAQFTLFEMVVLFDRGEGNNLLGVQGAMKFYVASRDSLHAGEVQPYYQLAGQVDLTQDTKATESSPWGTVLALYR